MIIDDNDCNNIIFTVKDTNFLCTYSYFMSKSQPETIETF